ncbi:type III-B CRISPR module RAMP protein Cmr4 [Candidatus Parcubacteria bacterium]|nr:MAG: type III-B CRISPR module RAMP protein Cmr4 [Candidatus Parcubacteria bacterium]
MQSKLMFLHALSPLHAGTGQGVGAIDLPIAREKGTEIPIVPASSLKGVLRDACAALHPDGDTCTHIFGPDTDNAPDHAGAIVLTDLRLVALPVRSLAGVFAWVSSPFLLQRLSRDAQLAGQSNLPVKPSLADEKKAWVSNNSALKLGNTIILEDMKLDAQTQADTWADWLAPQVFPDDATWQVDFKARFCIVHDDVMSYLLQVGTEVTARIRLEDDKKTVAKGALWYEEALPAESILAGLVAAQPNGKAQPADVFQIIGQIAGHPLQVGGNATVGRGLCRLSIA